MSDGSHCHYLDVENARLRELLGLARSWMRVDAEGSSPNDWLSDFRNNALGQIDAALSPAPTLPAVEPSVDPMDIIRFMQERADLLGGLCSNSLPFGERYFRNAGASCAIHNLANEIGSRFVSERRAQVPAADLQSYLTRQWEWSKRTFGPGRRTLGVIDHIRKELREVEAKPEDLSEWVDVTILAMDGYWRHGGKPENLMADLQAKQDKNFARTWPTPTSEDIAVEHDRTVPIAEPWGSGFLPAERQAVVLPQEVAERMFAEKDAAKEKEKSDAE